MKLLDSKQVAEKFGYSMSHFYNSWQRWCYEGTFPKPIRMTETSKPRWIDEEVEEYLRKKYALHS